MARIRVLREQEIVKAEVGREVDVDAATARALIARGCAERVVDRSNPEIERS